jgi:hypothetical protein
MKEEHEEVQMAMYCKYTFPTPGDVLQSHSMQQRACATAQGHPT